MDSEEIRAEIMDFGVRLLQHSIREGENTLVSPISVISALAMAANGAKGETLLQMEEVFGVPVTDLTNYLSSYMETLSEDEGYSVRLANSVWFTEDGRFGVNRDFLRKNTEYFRAGVYKAPFDDSTAGEINRWVEDKTGGLIKEIIDRIPSRAVMYLVDALAFDAEWQDIYLDYRVCGGSFTMEDGTAGEADFMYSNEYLYLEDDSAAGFIKYYAEGRYAYVALLPDKGLTVWDYISSLTGEGLRNLLDAPQDVAVSAALPKYESEFSAELSRILEEMGMKDAFDTDAADFSGIGTSTAGNIYINRVLHKTFIVVDERGTKAGAAAVVEQVARCALVEMKTVRLDRPFLYMIMDCEAGLPLFMGVCRRVGR